MNLLFLGDSITDCGHCFTPDNLGNGYVKYISMILQNQQSVPGQFPADKNGLPDRPHSPVTPYIVNGGSDGFTFPRILQKWKRNYQDAAWDAAVISGGINEVGYLMDADLSEDQSRQYLEYSMAALQELTASLLSRRVKVILLEPFLFPVPDSRIRWLPCLARVREHIRDILKTFISTSDSGSVLYVSPQPALDGLAREQGYAAVTTDGIHLTDAGSRCLAALVLPYLL